MTAAAAGARPAGGSTDLQVRYPIRREPSLSDVTVSRRRRRAGRRRGPDRGRQVHAGPGRRRVHPARRAGDGRAARSWSAASTPSDGRRGPAARRVGIVFATPANQLSASKLTVREELAFGLENLGVPRAEMDARIDAVLDRLGDRATSPTASRSRCPAASSSGSPSPASSRWAPTVLVLDEPTAQLDPAGTVSVAELLDELAAVGDRDPVRRARPRRCWGGWTAASCSTPAARSPSTCPVRRCSPASDAVGLRPPTLVRLARLAGTTPRARRSTRRRSRPASEALAALDRRARTVRRRPPGRRALDPHHDGPRRVDDLVHRYPNGVEAVRGVSLTYRAGRDRRDRRAERLGQDDAGEAPQRAAATGRGPGDLSTARRPPTGPSPSWRRPSGSSSRTPTSSCSSVRSSARSRSARATSGGQPQRSPGLVERQPRGGRAARRTRRRTRTTSTSRGASSWHSPGCWRWTRRSSSWTSRRPVRTRRAIERVEGVVGAYRAAGRTVVAITHDMEFAAANFATDRRHAPAAR